MKSKIEISYKTVIFAVVFIVVLWILIQIRDILFLLFISFLLMTALNPLVLILEKFRIPRLLGILLIYAIIIGLFGVSFASAIPTLISQSVKLIQDLPSFAARVLPYWNIDADTLTKQMTPIGENVVKLSIGIFSNIITTLTVLVFTFYFLLERRHAEDILKTMIGEAIARQVFVVLRTIEKRLSAWVHGELLLMAFIGIFSYAGLSFLRIDFALPLALIAGLLEIVPLIGPIVSAVPAVLVALATSPLLALTVIALFFIIQQIENNILVPIVMKQSVGLSPLVTILALMVGARFAGIVGALLAVPIVLVIQVVVEYFLNRQSKKIA